MVSLSSTAGEVRYASSNGVMQLNTWGDIRCEQDKEGGGFPWDFDVVTLHIESETLLVWIAR